MKKIKFNENFRLFKNLKASLYQTSRNLKRVQTISERPVSVLIVLLFGAAIFGMVCGFIFG